jgi:hypothetical protein
MLVNARLSYISVDGSHYSSGGQVIFTITGFYVSATAIVWIGSCMGRYITVQVER